MGKMTLSESSKMLKGWALESILIRQNGAENCFFSVGFNSVVAMSIPAPTIQTPRTGYIQ